MFYIIAIIVLTFAIILWYFETHSQHPSSIMGRYLRKKWENENPYNVVNVKNKTYTFYFNIDDEKIIRGVLFNGNEKISEAERRIMTVEEKRNDISDKLENLIVNGRQYKSIRIVIKGLKYISYWLEDENGLFQDYMEDRKWEGSIAKKIGIKGITNIFTM